jgi:hypothetical protein
MASNAHLNLIPAASSIIPVRQLIFVPLSLFHPADLVGLKDVDGFGQLSGAPGAA